MFLKIKILIKFLKHFPFFHYKLFEFFLVNHCKASCIFKTLKNYITHGYIWYIYNKKRIQQETQKHNIWWYWIPVTPILLTFFPYRYIPNQTNMNQFVLSDLHYTFIYKVISNRASIKYNILLCFCGLFYG